MQTIDAVNSPQAPKVYGPYSQAIVAGDLVFASGQLPLDPTSMEIVPGGIAEQAVQVLSNLKAVLQAAGADFDRVVKVTLYLVDLGDFNAFNEAYGKAFGNSRPARSTVEVAKLPRGARVEIDAIAVR